MGRRISREGIEFIKRFEGLRTVSYRDVAGVWTVGYGHTGPDVGPDLTISTHQADVLFKRDLRRFEGAVDRSVTTSVTQAQFDALVSLSYNIGVEAFRSSTALRRLNGGDVVGAAAAITWWNKATIGGQKVTVHGLTRRRAAEAALFLGSASDLAATATLDPTRQADGIEGGAVEIAENALRKAPPHRGPRSAMQTRERTTFLATLGCRFGDWCRLGR